MPKSLRPLRLAQPPTQLGRLFWLALLGTTACGESPKNPPEAAVDATAQSSGPSLLVAHTEGAVPRSARIHLELVQPFETEAERSRLNVAIEPELDVTRQWLRGTHLALTPKRPLDPKTRYRVTVRLDGKPVTSFSVWAVAQAFEVEWSGLDPSVGTFTGEIRTRDAADPEAVEKMLSAQLEGESLDTRWTHSRDQQRHRFRVSGIQRKDSAQTLVLQVDGSPLNIDEKVSHRAVVPGLGVFSVLSARASGRTGPIVLRFSDPIAPNQNPAGLIRVDSDRSLRFEVDGSEIRVFSSRAWGDAERIRISGSIRSAQGRRLGNARFFRVKQQVEKPRVRFVGDGVIIPLKPGSTLPVETSALKAVRVTATRIPPSNLTQFLQINALDETMELERVGRVVHTQRIELERGAGAANVRHGLDFSRLIETHGQGLYHVELSFRPDDVVYDCPSDAFADLDPAIFEVDDAHTDYNPAETSNWDFAWGAYISGLAPGAIYEQRNNPCHISYYIPQPSHDIRARQNVLLSNVGVMAKKGSKHALNVYVTDLLNTNPLTRAEIEVYDFSQQLLASGESDRQGMARFELERAPFSVLVKKDGQLGALRLHDGQSLSTSHFDTGGADVSSGLEGYIYGERGVWRPGDSIHLHFVSSDPLGRLPEGHPVSFVLEDPRGAIVDSQRIANSTGPFYCIDTRTDPEAPTGNYRATVRVGGASFSKTLSVESVVPNRLKLDLALKDDRLTGPKAELDTELNVRWLHGAVARSLKAEIDVAYTAMPTRFAKHQDHIFDDPTRSLNTSPERIFEGTLDQRGTAPVQATLELDQPAPGMARAHFTTRVYEPSGASSVERRSTPFSPFQTYIGVKLPKGDATRGMLLTDEDHPVRIAAVDADGEPVNTKVEVRLYKIHWRWWWEKGEEDLSQYAGQTSQRLLAKETVDVRDGEGEWTLRIDYPSWGRYLILVSDQNGPHRTGRVFYADWPGWAGRGQRENPGGPAVLSVATDSPRVQVGDPVTITFPAARQGRALLSLENGRQVLSSEWVEPEGETTRHVFTATADMVPTVYAHVTLLQPLGQTKNDRPARLYGIVPIEVVDPDTLLEPKLEVPEEVQPQSQANFTVFEAQGRPMGYTLSVVDEGLLGLTRFRTPNPWSHFHRKEALGVQSWDIFDRVAGAHAGALENLLAIGGGNGQDEAGDRKARRFPPVVEVLGPFQLKAGERRTHSVRIPPYLGEVRVMVTAATDSAYGAAEQAVPVRKPLMTLTSLPRLLSPADRVELPVTLFSTRDGPHQVSVKVESTDALRWAETHKDIFMDGAGEAVVVFSMDVLEERHSAEIRVIAESDGDMHREVVRLDIRRPNPPEITVVRTDLQPKRQWAVDLRREGMTEVSAELEISSVQPFGLSRRLGELVSYPHGCLEQTVSRAFPQLFLRSLTDLDAAQAERVRVHVQEAVDKLRRHQLPAGSFPVWPGGPSNPWVSVWAGHFLLEARRAGFTVPEDTLERWRKDQERQARSVSDADDGSRLTQAYRLYALALAGNPQLASMNRLRESKELAGLPRLRLAMAYALAGHPEAAESLIPDKDMDLSSRPDVDPTFGSPLRDEAMALEAWLLLDEKAQVEARMEAVARKLDSDEALHTQEMAFGLLALARYHEARTDPEPGDLRIILDGKRSDIRLQSPVIQKKLQIGSGEGRLSVENWGNDPVYVRLIRRGYPGLDDVDAFSRGIELSTELEPADEFVQGEDVEVTVQVRNTTGRRLEQLALTQMVPSGWEIRTSRFQDRKDPSGTYRYRDIRDDRVLTYFDLNPGEKKRFEVRLHAAFEGRFYHPPTVVEGMYAPEIRASTEARFVEVEKPGRSP